MDLEQLVTEFTDYLRICVDKEGIHPLPAWIVQEDGSREVLALAMATDPAVRTCLSRVRNTPGWRFVLFGVDVYCKPGQGTTLDSAFILMVLQPGAQPAVYVVEYSWNGGAPTVLPANGDNAFWKGQMEACGILRLARQVAGV
jgi:hypothetical protein